MDLKTNLFCVLHIRLYSRVIHILCYYFMKKITHCVKVVIFEIKTSKLYLKYLINMLHK